MAFKPLPPALKQRFINELRHGGLRQIRGALRKGDGAYCAMGVLGRVLGLDDYIDSRTQLATQSRLPRNLAPVIAAFDGRIMHMNDKEDRSFAQIADWVEAEL